MPRDLNALVSLLGLTRQGEHFIGAPGDTFFQRTYGGQVLAQALMAAYGTVPEGRTAHSLHAYFLRAASTAGDIDYEVDNLRDGGSFSARQVSARQNGQVCFVMSASFHIDEPGLDHAEAAPPDVAAPEDCPPFVSVLDERFGSAPILHEWDCLDVRFAGDSLTASPDENRGRPAAWMRLWVKTAGDLPPEATHLHQSVLAYLSDLLLLSVAVLPHKVVFISNRLQRASLDHSMWFHRPCRADRWLLYDMESPNAHGSLGFSTGRLFQDGQLIASCAQEGLIRLV